MDDRCGAECATAVQRKSCTKRACSGFRPACQALKALSADAEPRVPHEMLATPVSLAFRNEATEPVQLFWVDGLGEEQRFGALAPSARLEQGTYIGARWRLRTSSQVHPQRRGALLLEVRAGILEIGHCACEAHASTLSPYVPIHEPSANTSTLLMVAALPVTARVTKWTGVTDEVLGTLSPAASHGRDPNASSHLLLSGLVDGEVLSVRKANGGALLMQHVVGDVVVTDCSGGAPKARNADAAAERRRLQRTRSLLERENDVLRQQLGRLREVDLNAFGALPEAMLLEYASQAHKVLTQLEQNPAARMLNEPGGPRKLRDARSSWRDEL
uniref:von Hippel-Lindau disease tumour suppressor beta domain-containing protein n=1 Tax=Calcidiscus leptoporus TaxID=127549 RepID=A0A7S0IUP2_9EUKA